MLNKQTFEGIFKMEEIVKIKVNDRLRRVLAPEFMGASEVSIKLRSMDYGSYKNIKRKCIVIKEINGVSQQFRDLDLLDDLKVIASIVECPFDKTVENIYLLDLEEGMKLNAAAERVNLIDTTSITNESPK
jgi:hypothetical protein